jgi:hypothetical protein
MTVMSGLLLALERCGPYRRCRAAATVLEPLGCCGVTIRASGHRFVFPAAQGPRHSGDKLLSRMYQLPGGQQLLMTN